MKMKLFLETVLAFTFCAGLAMAQNENDPFPAYRIKEIEFKGGVVGASAAHTGKATWCPEFAFEPQSPIDKGWHLGPNSGPYSLPATIWYDFKAEGLTPSEVSFQPLQKDAIQQAPSSYQFVGSNDDVCSDASTWTVLCEDLSDRPWKSIFETRYCKVNPEITKQKFRCLGIRVLANSDTKYGWTSLRNIRMWQKIE